MTKTSLPRTGLILVLAIVAVLAPTMVVARSAYAGSWRGTWRSEPAIHQSGTVSIVVDGDSAFRGPLGNDALGLQGVVSGRIEADGTTQMTYSYDGGGTANAARGTFRHGGNKLVGSVRFTTADGRDLGTGTFELSDANATDL